MSRIPSWLEYHDLTKPPKEVKNLGWLLRNWKLVDCFTLAYKEGGKFGHSEAELIAYLNPNPYGIRAYHSDFASYSIAEVFLRRPVFYGVKLNGKAITK